MQTDRIRTVLYEGARILLSGVAIALLIVGAMRYADTPTPTLSDFRREYSGANAKTQVIVAENYLKRFSVDELVAEINGDSVDGVCHVQSHAIGRAVYKLNPSFSAAIKQCGAACTYGCFHGAMMEMFSTDSDTLGGAVESDSPEQYLARIKDVAPGFCWQPEVESQVSGRSCTHGLGHSFVILSNNLDEAVRACAVLTDKNAIDSCRAGVFMEYLLNPDAKTGVLSKAETPCDRYPADIAACYQYKAYGWVIAWGSGTEALRACAHFGDRSHECVLAVARAAATEAFADDAARIDSLCSVVTGSAQRTCTMGVYMKLFDLYNINDSDAVCEKSDDTHRLVCVEALQIYRDMYTFQRVI